MKKSLLSIVAALGVATSLNAQVGATAPDFTVTDLDGNDHNLHEILDAGKVVILDCSATWCGPCWGFHEGNFLQDLHDTYGPEGTDQLRVIFYEADPSTTLADLEGTGGSTLGNWLGDHTFPFINESSPLSLSGAVYWPLGYPTINVISPADKKIKADLFDTWAASGGLDEMVDVIDDHFTGTASVNENEALTGLSVYPNPAIDMATVSFAAEASGQATVAVYNLLGEMVSTELVPVNAGQNNVALDLNGFQSGNYILQVQLQDAITTSKLEVIR